MANGLLTQAQIVAQLEKSIEDARAAREAAERVRRLRLSGEDALEPLPDTVTSPAPFIGR